MFRKDHFLTGFIPALIVPFAGAIVFYFIFFNKMDFWYFLRHIINSQKWISVLSVGTMLNLGLFFFFYQKQLDKSARGVLGATFIFAFVVVYFKAF